MRPDYHKDLDPVVRVKMKKNLVYVKLRIPICANKEDHITISRMLGSRWRLIGYSSIVE